MQPATPTLAGRAGQFDDPLKLVFDRNDIMYVSDRDNFRIQRLTTDGTYVGEARSTGTGINTGDQPGFMLGNFGKPDRLSISAAGLFVMELRPQFGDYFVHVFKTLPFFDVTDNAATVRYVSYFDFQGTDSFSYRAYDGIDYSGDEAVSLSVARSFRPPERLTTECYTDETLAQRTPCTTDEETPLIVRAVGFDPDGFISTGGLDSLTFSLESTVRFGTLEPLSQTDNAAVYRYTPSVNFHGPDQFIFNASDGVASAAEPKVAELTVLPVPDPLDIELPENLVAGRGFPVVLAGRYSDPIAIRARCLKSSNWTGAMVPSRAAATGRNPAAAISTTGRCPRRSRARWEAARYSGRTPMWTREVFQSLRRCVTRLPSRCRTRSDQ